MLTIRNVSVADAITIIATVIELMVLVRIDTSEVLGLIGSFNERKAKVRLAIYVVTRPIMVGEVVVIAIIVPISVRHYRMVLVVLGSGNAIRVHYFLAKVVVEEANVEEHEVGYA